MGMVIKQTTAELLPVGEYPAVIAAIEPAEGTFGPQLKFTFELTGVHEGKMLMGWCSQSFNGKSKLFAWAKAAFARDIPLGWDLQVDTLLNRAVILAVTKKVGQDGSEYNRIDSVLPMRALAVKAPPPAAVEGPEYLPF